MQSNQQRLEALNSKIETQKRVIQFMADDIAVGKKIIDDLFTQLKSIERKLDKENDWTQAAREQKTYFEEELIVLENEKARIENIMKRKSKV